MFEHALNDFDDDTKRFFALLNFDGVSVACLVQLSLKVDSAKKIRVRNFGPWSAYSPVTCTVIVGILGELVVMHV